MADGVVRRDALKKVRFGNSDMHVTQCCIGSMTWGSFNGKEEEAFAQLEMKRGRRSSVGPESIGDEVQLGELGLVVAG